MRAAARTGQFNQDRRQFIVSVSLAAGGLALGIVSVRATANGSAFRPSSSDAMDGSELSPWSEIGKDDILCIVWSGICQLDGVGEGFASHNLCC